MKTLITILIICSILQSTIIPVDLVLIILICRSYVKSNQSNLFLAFSFGLFNDLLDLNLLGLHSIIYLMIVAITESLSKSRLAGNAFLIIPLTLFLTSLNQITSSIIISESVQLSPKILLDAFIALPILYLVRLWEERFIVKKGIKLRI